ncbi:MAG: BolA family protein [Rickettsiales bacterium]|nr:BolA family protein [Rickettsiales bacterium]
MNRHERICAILSRELNPDYMELEDNSFKHAGHAGASPHGETHYKLSIASAAFKGKSKVQSHQLIYSLLTDEFKAGLHALEIITKD